MNLMLTSDLPSTECPVVFDRMRDVLSRPRIAWIPPFTDVSRARFLSAQKQFRRFGFDDLEYYDIDEQANEAQLSQLEQYDIVYLSGGDPIRFRANILRTGLSVQLRRCLDKGRLLVGASGGSLQLTKNISLFRLQTATVDEVFADRNEYEALGFVRYELLPHLNWFDEEFLEKVREYSQRIEHDIVALHDGAAVLHRNFDDYHCVGKAARFRNGGMTPIEPLI
jgi:peptidase E